MMFRGGVGEVNALMMISDYVDHYYDHYYDHTKTKSKRSIWTEESIEENRYLFRNNKLKGNYKKSSVDEISRNIDEHMLEKVYVIE